MKKSWLFSLCILLLFTVSLAGCGGGAPAPVSPKPTADTKEVNIYTSRHYPGIDDAIYKSFTDKTGIKVNVIKASGEKDVPSADSAISNKPVVTVPAEVNPRTQ